MNWKALAKAVGIVVNITGLFFGFSLMVIHGGALGRKIAMAIFLCIVATIMIWTLYQYFNDGRTEKKRLSKKLA